MGKPRCTRLKLRGQIIVWEFQPGKKDEMQTSLGPLAPTLEYGGAGLLSYLASVRGRVAALGLALATLVDLPAMSVLT
ncbi:hypothetical protein NDU88_000426 [Pleurodeles waltl]|uniref:Uncharacterized protein n=1 Tax=Pleurodeles waltl TaxID=8319 RepID=A0AAV7UPY2_PLEWA|nr:hypothetical protein NDU88_000426 [Pleurodeles waltl]